MMTDIETFILDYAGVEDLNDFANLPVTEIYDAFLAFAQEVKKINFDDAHEYAQRMVEKTL